MTTTRGILLVANKKSQELCENLVYSIRAAGCQLPIKLIHFGGSRVDSKSVLKEVELVELESFSPDAKLLVQGLSSVLVNCPEGFLYRFLGWFLDWEEFLYSDNDVVALCDWTSLFDFLPNNDLVHFDKEFLTAGKYTYRKPDEILRLFGSSALDSLITAGHFLVRKDTTHVNDFNDALSWIRSNKGVIIEHDQAFLHLASLIGQWKIRNLCKGPDNWLSSWAYDYENCLGLMIRITPDSRISHLHYSGGRIDYTHPIHDLILSKLGRNLRLWELNKASIRHFLGILKLKRISKHLTVRITNNFIKLWQ